MTLCFSDAARQAIEDPMAQMNKLTKQQLVLKRGSLPLEMVCFALCVALCNSELGIALTRALCV